MRKSICIVLTVLAVLLLSITMLTGCGEKNETSLTGKNTEVYGKITAVNGGTVTVDVVTVPQSGNQGNPPEMQSGNVNPPEMQSGNVEPPEMQSGNVEPPEMQSGNVNPPEMQSGNVNPSEIPNGNPGGGLTTIGTTGTVSIDTSIFFKICDGGEISATLDDLSVGKILKITFDGNGTVSKIVIYEEDELFGNGNGISGGQTISPAR